MKRLHSQKGFTLIELLIVITVLGILVAIAIPNVSHFIHSGNVAAANTELSSVQTAAVAYVADNSPIVGFTSSVLGNYLSTPLKGSYSFNVSGGLTGTPTYPGLAWNSSKLQFE